MVPWAFTLCFYLGHSRTWGWVLFKFVAPQGHSLYIYFWVMSVGSTHISMIINLRHKVKSNSQMFIRFYGCMLGIGNLLPKICKTSLNNLKLTLKMWYIEENMLGFHWAIQRYLDIMISDSCIVHFDFDIYKFIVF